MATYFYFRDTQVSFDNYAYSNYVSLQAVGNGTVGSRGQGFKNASISGTLESCLLELNKQGSPGGSVYAEVWSSTGTFGSTAVPNALLATSEAIACADMAASTLRLYEFRFTGANRIPLSSGTDYFIVFKGPSGDASNYVGMASDTTPADDGNAAYYDTSWHYTTGHDFPFSVNIYPGPAKFICTSETSGAVTDKSTIVPDSKNFALRMITEAGPGSDTNMTGILNNAGTNPSYMAMKIFLSPPLAAQTLNGSQTFSVGLVTGESSGNMNLYNMVYCYIWRPGTGKVKDLNSTGTSLYAERCTSEHGTTPSECVITFTTPAGNFSILDEDVLVVEIWGKGANAKSTDYTETFYWNGSDNVMTDGADGSDGNAGGYFYSPQTLNLYTAPTAPQPNVNDTLVLSEATPTAKVVGDITPTRSDTLTFSDTVTAAVSAPPPVNAYAVDTLSLAEPATTPEAKVGDVKPSVSDTLIFSEPATTPKGQPGDVKAYTWSSLGMTENPALVSWFGGISSLANYAFNSSSNERGQCFKGDGGVLDKVTFKFQRTAGASGNMVARIYSTTLAYGYGYGADSIPETLLASSTAVPVTDIPSPGVDTEITFTFTGADKITLTAGTVYAVTVYYPGPDSTLYMKVGMQDYSKHEGNSCYIYSAVWYPGANIDSVFWLYKDTTRIIPEAKVGDVKASVADTLIFAEAEPVVDIPEVVGDRDVSVSDTLTIGETATGEVTGDLYVTVSDDLIFQPSSDDFNRADGALGDCWVDFYTPLTPWSGLVISSQAVKGVTTNYSGSCLRGGFANDQWAEVVTVAAPSATMGGPAVRMDPATLSGYLCAVAPTYIRLFRIIDASWVTVGASYSWTWEAGARIRISVIGNVIRLFLNGVLIRQATNDELTSGTPGIILNAYDNDGMKFDDFSCSPIPEPAQIGDVLVPTLSDAITLGEAEPTVELSAPIVDLEPFVSDSLTFSEAEIDVDVGDILASTSDNLHITEAQPTVEISVLQPSVSDGLTLGEASPDVDVGEVLAVTSDTLIIGEKEPDVDIGDLRASASDTLIITEAQPTVLMPLSVSVSDSIHIVEGTAETQTFGQETGTSDDTFSQDIYQFGGYINKTYQCPASGVLTELTAHCKSASAFQIRVGIYDSDGVLVAESQEITIPGTDTWDWYGATEASQIRPRPTGNYGDPVNLVVGEYYRLAIAATQNSGSLHVYYSDGHSSGDTGYVQGTDYSGGLPNSFPGTSPWTGWWQIRAGVEVAGGLTLTIGDLKTGASETLGIAEALTSKVTGALQPSVYDSLIFAEAEPSVQITGEATPLNASAVDTLILAEAEPIATVVGDIVPSVSDALTLGEGEPIATVIGDLIPSISDTLYISDLLTWQISGDLSASAQDTLILAEADPTVRITEVQLSVSDNLGIADTLSWVVTGDLSASLSDNLILGEAEPTVQIITEGDVNAFAFDALTFSEQTTQQVTGDLSRSISDGLTFTEENPDLLLGSVEVSVADTLNFQAPAPWLAGWTYRKGFTLSRPSGALTSYQRLVRVGESSGSSNYDLHCEGNVASDFDDLRFTDEDGNLLDYWIEYISGTTPNSTAYVWVEFNSIGTSDTQFYMYYEGTETAVSDLLDTWDAGDDGVTDNGITLATAGDSITVDHNSGWRRIQEADINDACAQGVVLSSVNCRAGLFSQTFAGVSGADSIKFGFFDANTLASLIDGSKDRFFITRYNNSSGTYADCCRIMYIDTSDVWHYWDGASSWTTSSTWFNVGNNANVYLEVRCDGTNFYAAVYDTNHAIKSGTIASIAVSSVKGFSTGVVFAYGDLTTTGIRLSTVNVDSWYIGDLVSSDPSIANVSAQETQGGGSDAEVVTIQIGDLLGSIYDTLTFSDGSSWVVTGACETSLSDTLVLLDVAVAEVGALESVDFATSDDLQLADTVVAELGAPGALEVSVNEGLIFGEAEPLGEVGTVVSYAFDQLQFGETVTCSSEVLLYVSETLVFQESLTPQVFGDISISTSDGLSLSEQDRATLGELLASLTDGLGFLEDARARLGDLLRALSEALTIGDATTGQVTGDLPASVFDDLRLSENVLWQVSGDLQKSLADTLQLLDNNNAAIGQLLRSLSDNLSLQDNVNAEVGVESYVAFAVSDALQLSEQVAGKIGTVLTTLSEVLSLADFPSGQIGTVLAAASDNLQLADTAIAAVQSALDLFPTVYDVLAIQEAISGYVEGDLSSETAEGLNLSETVIIQVVTPGKDPSRFAYERFFQERHAVRVPVTPYEII